MPFVKHAVGDHLWLWTREAGVRGSGAVCISAHGGVARHAPTKRIRGVTLHFYSEHGYALNDPRLVNVVYGAVKPRQIVGPDPDIQDYELSKYTNTSDDRKQHNDARETYVTVGGMVESATHKAKIANGQLKDFATFMQLASATEQKIDFDQLRTDYEREVRFFGREPLMDIVTIRNRWWTFQITLSEVVAELAKANFNYTDIHCSFCRSEYKGGKLSQSAQPAD